MIRAENRNKSGEKYFHDMMDEFPSVTFMYQSINLDLMRYNLLSYYKPSLYEVFKKQLTKTALAWKIFEEDMTLENFRRYYPEIRSLRFLYDYMSKVEAAKLQKQRIEEFQRMK